MLGAWLDLGVPGRRRWLRAIATVPLVVLLMVGGLGKFIAAGLAFGLWSNSRILRIVAASVLSFGVLVVAPYIAVLAIAGGPDPRGSPPTSAMVILVGLWLGACAVQVGNLVVELRTRAS